MFKNDVYEQRNLIENIGILVNTIYSFTGLRRHSQIQIINLWIYI